MEMNGTAFHQKRLKSFAWFRMIFATFLKRGERGESTVSLSVFVFVLNSVCGHLHLEKNGWFLTGC